MGLRARALEKEEERGQQLRLAERICSDTGKRRGSWRSILKRHDFRWKNVANTNTLATRRADGRQTRHGVDSIEQKSRLGGSERQSVFVEPGGGVCVVGGWGGWLGGGVWGS